MQRWFSRLSSSKSLTSRQFTFALAAVLVLLAGAGAAGGGVPELGRNDIRVYSGEIAVRAGVSVAAFDLAGRLQARGYTRVRQRPQHEGEFFWGFDVFWIYQKSYDDARGSRRGELVGLRLRRPDGVIVGLTDRDLADGEVALTLEPLLLAEDLDGRRATRIPVRFDDLPEHVWRPLLAAEDARFFDHRGIDGRGVARALLANLRAGKVAQGGSTITQQLIKMRDLTPNRTLGRKVSEAVRALRLEAEYDKEDILEEYLNHVYLGHVDGVSLYGYGIAARAFFGRDAEDLTLAQATLLAAIIQAPNRYSPVRNPGGVSQRYTWILDRLVELDWVDGSIIARSRSLPNVKATSVIPAASATLLRALQREAERVAPARSESGRGFVVHTTIDPWLQGHAERVLAKSLREIRSRGSSARSAQAALIAIRAGSGEVVAYVGGGGDGVGLDRVRKAQRQPGSSIKPFVLAHAFADCGDRDPLYPSRRVSNESWSLDLPSGRWQPQNPDRSQGGTVTLREATVRSLNLPFARVGAWCGWEQTASTLRRAGLKIPTEVPPAFVLGAVEVSPWDLASAYTAILGDGRRSEPRMWTRIRRPSGTLVASARPQHDRVVPEQVAFLIRDILRQAVAEGSARAARIEGVPVLAKTGTSSRERDAWTVGGVGDLVVAVWVGRDDGQPLALSGGQAAAPLFRRFVERAVDSEASLVDRPPSGVERQHYDAKTGLIVAARHRRARQDWFATRDLPPRKRWWRNNEPVPAIQ